MAGFSIINTGSGNVEFTDSAPALTVDFVIQASGANVQISRLARLAWAGPIAAGPGNVTLTATGAISENGGEIGGDLLTTSSAGGATLNGPNAVLVFIATNTGSGDVEFTDTAPTLTVESVVQAGGGNVQIINSGWISMVGALAAGPGNVTLSSAGTIAESGGEIGGNLLTTNSAGGTTLNGFNAVSAFNATNTGSGDVEFTDTAPTLTVESVVEASGENVQIINSGSISVTGPIAAGPGKVTLTAMGAISENGGEIGGYLHDDYFGRRAILNGPNALSVFSATNTTSGDVEFSDTTPTLAIVGINQSGGNVQVTNTGSISVTGPLSAGTGNVTLTATGTVDENGGAIERQPAHHNLGWWTILNGADTVSAFSATNTTSGDVEFSDTTPTLAIVGINQSGGNVQITNTGSISLTGPFAAGTGNVTLTATGAIAENSGPISGNLLTTTSAGGTILNGANTVSAFTPRTPPAATLTSATRRLRWQLWVSIRAAGTFKSPTLAQSA